MTLTTPILNNITTFDPLLDTQISFSYSDNQIKKKRLIITNSKTSTTVYDEIQLGMKLSYLLTGQTLPVGQYTAQIQVFDFDENASELSSPVLFYCYSSPEFSFQDFTNTIHSGTLSLSLEYIQAENEKLKEYTYYLYDFDKSLLKTSNTFFTLIDEQFSFYGLRNEQNYYVQCKGKTVHGMTVDTGLNEVYVDYVMQPNNVLLKLTNHINEGFITIDCNIIDIGYEFDNDNYEIVDGELILSNNKITYKSGFKFSDEFSIFIKSRKLPLGGTFLILKTLDGKIELSIIERGGEYYCKLSTESAIDTYNRYTYLPYPQLIDTEGFLLSDTAGNQLRDSSTEYKDEYTTVFELKRKNGLYSLNAYYERNGLTII